MYQGSSQAGWHPGAALAEVSARLGRLPLQGPQIWLYHEALASMHALLAAAQAAEASGTPVDQMWEATVEARRFFGRHSSILAHTQRWPRGYPGDFELIERLLDARPAGPIGSLAYALDQSILQLPIVAQHRAKVAWQAEIVRQRVRQCVQSDGNIRVLSIASGGSRDLIRLDPDELAKLTVVLTDLDGEALALSRTRLEGRVRELVCVQGNVLRNANRLRATGPFDVILVGGLLDYLPDRAARTLMKQAAGMLSTFGLIAVTNIAAGNPWRLLLELVADWGLIHRDENEMRALVESADVRCDLRADHTGLTWLATASRGAFGALRD